MKGILYGVGTGPGDPELLTLKALKIIRESDIIVIPADDPKDCASYQTVERAFPQIREKRLICLPFPMVRDREKRRIQQEKNAEIIAKILSEGKQAAFLTIGDPSIYSTYGYIHNILRRRGFDARIVSGIPSFCAAVASLGEILCEDRETLEILPSFPLSEKEPTRGGRDISGILSGTGTKVLMKPSGDYTAVTEALRRSRRTASMAVNCGRDEEQTFSRLEDFPEKAEYFSVIISRKESEPFAAEAPVFDNSDSVTPGKEVIPYE